MHSIYHLFISLFIFSYQLVLAEENPSCQFDTALELFIGKSKSVDKEITGNVGFIAAKSALETYKKDTQKALILKEAMCRCIVSKELTLDQLKIAEEVIIESKNPLSIGIAWYRKSRISYFNSDYQNALIYSEIALQTLKKAKVAICENGDIDDK